MSKTRVLFGAFALGVLLVLSVEGSIRAGTCPQGPEVETQPQGSVLITAVERQGIHVPSRSDSALSGLHATSGYVPDPRRGATDFPRAPQSFSFDPGHRAGLAPETIEDLVSGDLDWDARPDLVSAGASHLLAWQNPASPFSSAWVSHSVGTAFDTLYTVALGDLDGDGYPDLASGQAYKGGYQLQIWQNDSTPFAGPWTSRIAGTTPYPIRALALGDLDDDGYPDIISGDEGGGLRIWQNDATPFNSSWISREVATTPGGSGIRTLAVGKLYYGGIVIEPLPIVSGDEAGQVIVWWPYPYDSPFSGTWYSHTVSTITDTVESLALVDLDDDGDLDIVAGCGPTEDYEVISWRYDSRTDWTQQPIGALSAQANAVAAADLDVDGDPDVVSGSAADPTAAEVRVWENDGFPFAGTWGASDVEDTGVHVLSLATPDLDRDGDLDLVGAAGRRITAWSNRRAPYWGTWVEGVQPSPADASLGVDVADFDFNGKLDIATGTDGHGVAIWRGDGGYSWLREAYGSLPDTGVWSDIAWGGFGDSAEYLDLAAANRVDGLRAWQNDEFGSMWWDLKAGLPLSGTYRALALSRVNRDNRPDLVACGDGLGVGIWELTGSTWITRRVLAGMPDLCDVAVGQVDHDGDPDIVAAGCSSAGISLRLGDGDFGFTHTAPVTTTGSYAALALGDLNRDGRTDVVAAPTAGGVRAWLGDSGGTWTYRGTLSPTLTVLSLDLGDFERNGYPDLVIGTDGDGIRVWRASGGSWTQVSAGLPVSGTFHDVAFGQVDGDAMLDIVAAGDDGVHVYFAMEPPPGGWREFQPVGWVTALPVTATVKVADAGSGLAVGTAAYRYTVDCDATDASWSNWAPAPCSGVTGTTAMQTISTTVPFTQDSATGNCLQFRIWDTSGLTGTSPIYLVALDTAPPTNPVLTSTTHTTATWHNSRNIRVAWSGASDATAGVSGYSYLLDTAPATVPDGILEASSNVWDHQAEAPADGDNWYFHLRTRDRAGHWSPATAHLGPFYVDAAPPANCSISAPGTASDTTFGVDWSCDEDTGSDIDTYEIQVREVYQGQDSGWQPLWEIGSWQLPYAEYRGARGFASYYFRMRARDEAGNVSAYTYSGGTTVDLPPTNVDMVLSIDDAAPGVAVSKLIPDADGPADHTWVDVIVRLEPDEPIHESFTFHLSKPPELGDPVSVRVYTDTFRVDGGADHWWYGTDDTLWVAPSNLIDVRYFVFRFRIEPDIDTDYHWMQAEIDTSIHASGSSNQVTLRLEDSGHPLILTNRTRLFQEFSGDRAAVRSLLRTLYDLVDYEYIYYVDDYSPEARDWDPLSVTYWDDSTNQVNDVIDDLIEDWVHDTDYDVDFLLLVGDDPIIPYRRSRDPTHVEADHAYSGTHPILDELTQHDGMFTDAKYADLDDKRWTERPISLALGRIVGLTPDDMLTLVQSGDEGPDVSNRNFVAASYDGADFDALDEIQDFGFEVLYDGQGESWDMVESDSWTSDTIMMAMQNEFAAFGHCGHGSHTSFCTPTGCEIYPGRIDDLSMGGGHYSDTHPLFGFCGCRVGFSLGQSLGASILYALVHEGASGVVASMSISWYDPRWNDSAWGEKLMRDYWEKLLPVGSPVAIGEALRTAKRDYDEGWDWDGQDHKTIMGYTLFGLPWTPMPQVFSSASVLAADGGTVTLPPFSPAFGTPQPTGIAGTYFVTATLDGSHYTVLSDVIPGFDVLQVEGMDLSDEPGFPFLPMARYTMTLPADAQISAVGVMTGDAVVLTDLDLPTFVPVTTTMGVLDFGETPAEVGLFPTQPYTYRVTRGDGYQRVALYLMPAAYDSAADQATLCQSMTLTVTYQVTYPVVLHGLYATQVPQPPDQPVVLKGMVMNAGSEPITVTPQIELEDLGGHILGPQASPPVLVSPGGASWLTASFSPTTDLSDGPYMAHLTLWRGPTIWAEAFVDVNVAGGQITRLRGPKTAWPGETAVFTVTFRNNRSEAVSIVPWLAVSDLDGIGIASLSGVTQTVPAGSEMTFTLTWPNVPNRQGRLAARAWAAQVLGDAIGDVYGPATWFVDLPRQIYLPLVMRNS
jgi:hypothetical protein